MKGVFVFRLCLLCMALAFTSCHKEDAPNVSPCGKTLFMYMPWSGDRNALTSYFYTNISDMENAVREVGLDDERVVVSSMITEIMWHTCAETRLCSVNFRLNWNVPFLKKRIQDVTFRLRVASSPFGLSPASPLPLPA